MTLNEIKKAVDKGKTVCWENELYEVRKAGDDYNIVCTDNGYTIGLTWLDGVTMNGEESEFYIHEGGE